MNSNLQFDFAVDKPNKTVRITRTFAAPQSLVWDAFTQKEFLDEWWAPKPFRSITKYMNFEEGGKRFYAMVSPEGHQRWSLQAFSAIDPKSTFTMYNTFADESEQPELPGSEWKLDFSEENGITKVLVTIKNESVERMDRMIEMGFKEGFTMTLEALSQILIEKSKR